MQLSGFAKSQSERTRAGEIVRSVQGVTEVHNNLVVAP
nr:BON domain-containing protein [Castellaniella caeni]